MTTYVTPVLQTIYTEIGSAFVLWMRPTVTIVSLIRKNKHANTHNRLTIKLWLKQVWVVLLNWVIQKDNSTTSTRTPQKHTQKKPESWDELSKPPATQSLSSHARVTTHTNLETHVCVYLQSEADETTITADGLILPHTHTHTHTQLKLTIS